MNVLGIESTCDETAAAIVKNGEEIVSHAIASSSDIHEKYGGVFPELASRRHIDAILPVIEMSIAQAGLSPEEIDLIAVAKGPGLIGSLLVGMQVAKGLSIAWKKPLVGVNHVEAHLFAAMMKAERRFPALGFVLSGGHTLMVKIEDVGRYQPIGTTVDDALGEAFDKVASLLGMPYPGGPHVETLARLGNPQAHPFRAGRVKKNPLDFSFSGIKTSVLYAVKGQTLSDLDKANVAASFQEAAFSDLILKAKRAIELFPFQAIYFGGGVCQNSHLRALFQAAFPSLALFWPSLALSADNAAMIAGLGFYKFLQKKIGDPLDLEVETRIPL